MKKAVILIISVIILGGLAFGGYYIYKTGTPEYALMIIISDTRESGLDGLKKHLTANAAEKLETVQDKVEESDKTSILGNYAKKKAIAYVKSKVSEIQWSVEDILRGDKNAEVVIGFDLDGSVKGTINIIMIKENREWKIDGLGFPQFEKLELQ